MKHLRHSRRQAPEGHFKVCAEFRKLQAATRQLTFDGHLVHPENGVVPRFLIAPHRSGVNPNGALAAGVAQMVVNLVAQNADQPRPLGGFAGETVARLQRGQERLLHEVFSHARVAQLSDGEVEEIISVRFHPIAGRCGFGHRTDRFVG